MYIYIYTYIYIYVILNLSSYIQPLQNHYPHGGSNDWSYEFLYVLDGAEERKGSDPPN